jgi:hypothetical protein
MALTDTFEKHRQLLVAFVELHIQAEHSTELRDYLSEIYSSNGLSTREPLRLGSSSSTDGELAELYEPQETRLWLFAPIAYSAASVPPAVSSRAGSTTCWRSSPSYATALSSNHDL